ncbi:unnamed protein product [Mycena citricolor]|uniref:Uncharacterized protein n=1 Tax=Mycena citricolor TaxID=2018698 RepID=A0AAD2HTH0_9AGAR|nr:unnamed protein product [Mycena citricolor]
MPTSIAHRISPWDLATETFFSLGHSKFPGETTCQAIGPAGGTMLDVFSPASGARDWCERGGESCAPEHPHASLGPSDGSSVPVARTVIQRDRFSVYSTSQRLIASPMG